MRSLPYPMGSRFPASELRVIREPPSCWRVNPLVSSADGLPRGAGSRSLEANSAATNGVAGATDGSVIYVNDWNDGTLRIVPLKKGASLATIKLGDFHPDNVHLQADGNLLIAGQIGNARDILACATQTACATASMIVVVDPKQGSVLSQQIVAPTRNFGAAATALKYGKDFWLSSFRGDRIVRVPVADVSTTSQKE
jgi:sugar lactone lactonase YvrE